MARYLLVQVDDNDRADALMKKLEPVAGMRVIGLFGRPTKFCEDKSHRDINERSTRGPRYGWWHCSTCGKAKQNMFHVLTNLLDPDEFNKAIEYRDMYFNIREPYEPPLEKYGADRIAHRIELSKDSQAKLDRANNPRVQARREASRQRRREKKARMRNR